jgi:Tfp pilus assembly protein PilW
MKLDSFGHPTPVGRRRQRRAGFTVTEVMLAVALLVMVVGGTMSAHLFGLRLFELAESKLGASDDARKAISRLAAEVRAAKVVKVGNGDSAAFTEAAPDAPQQGNAIQLYPTGTGGGYVRYYLDSSEQALKRWTSDGTGPATVARYITNQIVFTAEDYAGSVQTNRYNNRVIGLTLQFYQIQYPVYQIGPGNYYDFYQLRTRMTRRTLE